MATKYPINTSSDLYQGLFLQYVHDIAVVYRAVGWVCFSPGREWCTVGTEGAEDGCVTRSSGTDAGQSVNYFTLHLKPKPFSEKDGPPSGIPVIQMSVCFYLWGLEERRKESTVLKCVNE